MNQLDARAARAVDAVHIAVATRAPIANLPRLVAQRRRALAARVAAGFAAVVAVVGIAGLVQLDDSSPPAEQVTTTAVVTTTTVVEIEQPSGSVIPIPEGPSDPEPTEPEGPAVVDPVEPKDPEVPEEPVEPVEPADTTPPPLTITDPDDGATVEEKVIAFRGTTEPGATVAAGSWAADVDAEGNWSIVLVLSEGANRATFTATDAAGNQTVKSISVTYEPPPPPKETAKLVANAKYGSSVFDPPYDIYYGTAEPGATISVTSEYGSGSTKVDVEGQWEIKVFFPEAPYGVAFLVKVKDGLGGVKSFEFTSFAGDA